jgi:hypothetical protein
MCGLKKRLRAFYTCAIVALMTTTMKTLKQLITDEQRGNDAADNRLRSFAINHFGKGDHPFADADSLSFFEAPYVRECLLRCAASDKVNPQARARAKELAQ